MEEAPERFISGKKKKRSLKEENGHISMNYAESRRSVTILSHTGGCGGGGTTTRIAVFINKGEGGGGGGDRKSPFDDSLRIGALFPLLDKNRSRAKMIRKDGAISFPENTLHKIRYNEVNLVSISRTLVFLPTFLLSMTFSSRPATTCCESPLLSLALKVNY